VCSTGNCTFPNGDPIDNAASEADSSFSTVGICSSCLDISSLVGPVKNNTELAQWSLPNGQWISFENSLYSSGCFANLTVNSDFSWLGDLISPEFAQASRWAVANVTSLAFSSVQCGPELTPQCPLQNYFASGQTNNAVGPIAAACALYPCIRRTVPSIKNNNFSEVPIDTTPLWPAVLDTFVNGPLENNPNWPSIEADAGEVSATNVQTIYTTQNASTAPNATTLLLYETLSDGTSQFIIVSAPESCIYRQSEAFTYILWQTFNSVLPALQFLQLSCFYTSENGIACGSYPVNSESITPTESLGISTGMYNLYSNGNATVSAIGQYFESFARAFTNRYRSTFGSSIYVAETAEPPDLLPIGEVQGIVWQDSVCTSAQWEWLLLPAILVLLTCFLLLWTVAGSWRRRHIEPVWKENVLPAMLYRDKFRERDGSALGEMPGQSSIGLTRHPDQLLEIDEMETLAKRTMVKFRWSEDGGHEMAGIRSGTEEEDSRKEVFSQGRGWLKRRTGTKSTVDSNSHPMSER
jgi:hypothetical protein